MNPHQNLKVARVFRYCRDPIKTTVYLQGKGRSLTLTETLKLPFKLKEKNKTTKILVIKALIKMSNSISLKMIMRYFPL